ncbi:MAG: BRCT domain-containing protein [Spirochaetota bacterium]
MRKEKDERLQVCFTGFGATKKLELESFADSKNIKVVKSVTKNLDFLCAGDNADYKKLEKAEAQGVQVLSEKQFQSMLTTGEIPNEK